MSTFDPKTFLSDNSAMRSLDKIFTQLLIKDPNHPMKIVNTELTISFLSILKNPIQKKKIKDKNLTYICLLMALELILVSRSNTSRTLF